jgi:hypothetical protein
MRDIFCWDSPGFLKGIILLISLLLLTLIAGLSLHSFASEGEDGQTSYSVRMLEPEQKEKNPADRCEPALTLIPLNPGPVEMKRNSGTTFTLRLSQPPIIACLEVQIFHQGTDEKPVITVNGSRAGTLEPSWHSLKDRDYIFFLFDDNPAKSNDYQVDYKGWLEAKCFIDGRLLRVGENTITLGVKNDWVRIKDIAIEALYRLDSADAISDCRESTWRETMKEIELHHGRIRQ